MAMSPAAAVVQHQRPTVPPPAGPKDRSIATQGADVELQVSGLFAIAVVVRGSAPWLVVGVGRRTATLPSASRTQPRFLTRHPDHDAHLFTSLAVGQVRFVL